MTSDDTKWVNNLLAANMLDSPVLELGVGYDGATSRELIEKAGLKYFGTDIEKTPAVDFIANFEREEDLSNFSSVVPFGSILVLNVLEHTFDPIRILDNCLKILKPGGRLAVLTPAVWPLHNFPMDTWRIQPNFYEEYAKRRSVVLESKFFEYAGFGHVAKSRDTSGNYRYPPPSGNRMRYYWSKAVHKCLNTFGRGMMQPSHVAVAALFIK